MADVASNTGRKRRADGWEIRAGLDDAQQARVFAWARALGYSRALALIQKELQVKPPSMGAFSAWYAAYSRKESAERVHRAVVDSAAIRELADKGGDVSEAMLKALETEAAAAIMGGDPDRIKLLVELALRARVERRGDEALELAKRKLAAAEAKVAEAKRAMEAAAGKAKAGGLDAEAIAEIEKAAKLL